MDEHIVQIEDYHEVEQRKIPSKKDSVLDIGDMAYSPYMDLFFPFIIHEEHRLSE